MRCGSRQGGAARLDDADAAKVVRERLPAAVALALVAVKSSKCLCEKSVRLRSGTFVSVTVVPAPVVGA